MGETTNARLINPAVILVATDLSDLHRIVPFAIQMAEKTGARLELLHILQFGGEFTTDAAGLPYYDREGAFSIAMNMLQPGVNGPESWGCRANRLSVRAIQQRRRSFPQFGSFTQTDFSSAPGAAASSANCFSAPSQSKCCARQAYRSLP